MGNGKKLGKSPAGRLGHSAMEQMGTLLVLSRTPSALQWERRIGGVVEIKEMSSRGGGFPRLP